MMTKQLGAMLALSACAAVQAQAIYRCADGYSQQPCTGGSMLAVEPAPTPKQRRAAVASTQRDARAADALEKERLKQEAQPAAAYIPPPKHEPGVEPQSPPAKAGLRKPDLFTATAPGTRKDSKHPATAGKSEGKKKKRDDAAATAKTAPKPALLSAAR